MLFLAMLQQTTEMDYKYLGLYPAKQLICLMYQVHLKYGQLAMEMLVYSVFPLYLKMSQLLKQH